MEEPPGVEAVPVEPAVVETLAEIRQPAAMFLRKKSVEPLSKEEMRQMEGATGRKLCKERSQGEEVPLVQL